VTFGEVTDRRVPRVVDPDGDELGEPRAAVVEDAECAVARLDQVDSGLHDALQHGGQVEIAADGQHRVEQLAQTARTRELSHRCEL
jgi:hypothetical protein